MPTSSIARLKQTIPETPGKPRFDVLLQIATLLERFDATDAHNHASESLRLAHELDDPHAVGLAKLSLGKANWGLSRLEEASLHLQDAQSIFRELNAHSEQAASHLSLGKVHILRSRYTDAFQELQSARTLFRSLETPLGVAAADNCLAVVSRHQGDCARALRYLREAEGALRKHPDPFLSACIYTNFAEVHHDLDLLDSASSYLDSARLIFERLGTDRCGLANVMHDTAEIHRERNQNSRALEVHLDALSIRESFGHERGIASSCDALGRTYLALGDFETATTYLDRALRTAKSCGIPSVELRCFKSLTALHQAQGNYETALEFHMQYNSLQEGLFADQRLLVLDLQARHELEMKEKEATLQRLRYAELEREIEDRKNSEEALVQSQKLESLGRLAGGVAHGFNNLLVAIVGNTELAAARLPQGHESRSELERVIEASERAGRLASEMLTYSDKTHFDFKAVDLSQVVRDSALLLSTAVGPSVELKQKLARKLVQVNGDSVQLSQVLINLVINAAESNADRIDVVTRRVILNDQNHRPGSHHGAELPPGDYVALEVQDDGDGIESTVRDRLFDPFFTTKFAGRGLGLASVLGIVRRHNAAIDVQSSVGHGSLFRVFFPAKAPDQSGRVSPAKPNAPNCPIRTVLVIDDEEVVRRVTAAVLESAGVRALSVSSGEAGLEMYQEHRTIIDVVLLDLNMPGLGGAETLEELRSIAPEVAVVVTSPYEKEQALFSIEEDVRFLRKPYNREILLRSLGVSTEK